MVKGTFKKSLAAFLSVMTALVMTQYAFTASAATVIPIGPFMCQLDDATQTAAVEGPCSNPTGDVIIPAAVTYASTTYTVTSVSGFSGKTANFSITIEAPNLSIESDAFKACGITQVNVSGSGSIGSIGDNAFFNSGSLQSIDLSTSGNFSQIGNSAFANCSSLQSIDLSRNSSLTQIGEGAFSGSNITSVTIPASVTIIGNGAFENCQYLMGISVDPNNRSYSSDGHVLFNQTKTDLICCPAGFTGNLYTVPDDVTQIDSSAFQYCSNLTSVNLDARLATIGNNAFDSCGLTSVTIPGSVTSIGTHVFPTTLSSVTFAGETPPVIDQYAFDGCSIGRIQVPFSVLAAYTSALGGHRGVNITTISVIAPIPGPTPVPAHVYINQTGFAFSGGTVTKTYGDAPFTVTAAGGQSAGAVTYQSNNDVVSVDNTGKVTINKAGTAMITAVKAGDGSYYAATASMTVTVNPASQTGFAFSGGHITKAYGDAPFIVTAAGGQGTGAVTYQSSSDAVSVDNTGKVTINKAGTVTITATKAGDGNYNPATATVTVTVNPASQTGFAFPESSIDKTYGDAPFTVTAAGGQGTGAVTYQSSSNAVSVDNTGKITVNDVGTATITATKAGNGNYNAATAAITVSVTKADSSVETAPKATSITVVGKLASSKLKGGSGSVPGSFSWSDPGKIVSKSGSYNVIFTPDDTDHYNSAAVKVSVTVNHVLSSKYGIKLDFSGAALQKDETSVLLANPTVGRNSAVYAKLFKLQKGKNKDVRIYSLKLLNQDKNTVNGLAGFVTVKIPVSAKDRKNKVFFFDRKSEKLTDIHAGYSNGFFTFKATQPGYYAVIK